MYVHRQDQPAADWEGGVGWGGSLCCPVLSCAVLGPQTAHTYGCGIASNTLIDACLLGNAYHPDCHMGGISNHTLCCVTH